MNSLLNYNKNYIPQSKPNFNNPTVKILDKFNFFRIYNNLIKNDYISVLKKIKELLTDREIQFAEETYFDKDLNNEFLLLKVKINENEIDKLDSIYDYLSSQPKDIADKIIITLY